MKNEKRKVQNGTYTCSDIYLCLNYIRQMKINPKYISFVALVLALSLSLTHAQPVVGIYPPQVHQQICQESTYTRYLNVFNTGDSLLIFNAAFTPGPYSWVTAEPLQGEVAPGDTIQIAFTFNSAGLAIDNYYSYLLLSCNDPKNPEQSILGMLHVQDITIFLEPESDSICAGCNTKLTTIAFGCSEEYQFHWTSDPPGFTSSEKSPVVAPLVNTTYTVQVTDGGGSAEKSVFIRVYGSSDVEENTSLSKFSVFPNPTDGPFILSLYTEKEGSAMVHIYSVQGKEVYSHSIDLHRGDNEYFIDHTGPGPGMYFIIVDKVTATADFHRFCGRIIVK